MKKFLCKNRIAAITGSLLIACCACLNFAMPSSITAHAADTYTEGKYDSLTYDKYSNHIEITSYDGSVSDVVIPEKIEGLPVTIIANYAFNVPEWAFNPDTGNYESICANLKSIELPNTLKRIEDGAFTFCYNLKEIVIPASVDYIGMQAFEECKSLRSITIKNPNCHIYNYNDWYELYTSDPDLILRGYEYLLEWAKDSIENYDDYVQQCIKFNYDILTVEELEIQSSITFDDYIKERAKNEEKSTISNNGAYSTSEFDEWYAYIGTIYGYSGSTAADYARLCGKTFVSISELISGDVNCDGEVNAIDASAVLSDYAIVSTGYTSLLDDLQKTAADVNGDGVVDARDASVILSYYAYTATGGTESLENFMKK